MNAWEQLDMAVADELPHTIGLNMHIIISWSSPLDAGRWVGACCTPPGTKLAHLLTLSRIAASGTGSCRSGTFKASSASKYGLVKSKDGRSSARLPARSFLLPMVLHRQTSSALLFQRWTRQTSTCYTWGMFYKTTKTGRHISSKSDSVTRYPCECKLKCPRACRLL